MMKTCFAKLVAGLMMLLEVNAVAAVLCVDLDNTSPAPPYAAWSTAATNIQDAVDAATDGDLILVSNGTYAVGGRVEYSKYGAITNRLVVDKAVIIESVNGPAVTAIQGYQMPGTTNGADAIRCAYLLDGAVLSGFTLTGGATSTAGMDASSEGGGIWCESTNVVISNCVFASDAGYWQGGAAYAGTFEDCVFSNNFNKIGSDGGGGDAVSSATLVNCTLTGNFRGQSFDSGGVAYLCNLSDCLLTSNLDAAAVNCTLDNCRITENSGTGVVGGTADHSVISGNSARAFVGDMLQYNGGGACQATLNYCTVSNNWAKGSGGGLYSTSYGTGGEGNILVANSAGSGGGAFLTAGNWTMLNWQFISNSATTNGGGLYAGVAFEVLNSTFSGNSAGDSGGGLYAFRAGTANVCSNCTFYNNTAGTNGGGVWGGTPDGCLVSGNRAQNGAGVYGGANNCVITGNVATADGGGLYMPSQLPQVYTNCVVSGNVAGNGGGLYVANNWPSGRCSNWVFADNTALTNGGGFCGASQLQGCTIVSNQAAFGGGGYGGSYIGCTVAGNFATNGGGLDAFSSVSNCVLSCNTAANDGGGAYGALPAAFSEAIERSVFDGNSAWTNGGGAWGCSLVACIIETNSAGIDGGGAYDCSTVNSLMAHNTAISGGGLYVNTNEAPYVANNTLLENAATSAGGGIYYVTTMPLPVTPANCIIYYNSAPFGANYALSSTNFVPLRFCCTTPMPPTGTSNIVAAPNFIDLAGGNFRLQTNSPCINAGSNTYYQYDLGNGFDLDGRPRFVGPIDIGADEFQGAGVGEFIGWLQQYDLATDGSADYADTDADGMNNWQEWIAGTNPTNALSVLKMLPPIPDSDKSGVTVSWQSVSGRRYALERGTDLGLQPAFSIIQGNIVGEAGITTVTDTNAVGGEPYFYRVGVGQ